MAKKLNAKGKQAYKLVKALFIARRNQKIDQEQEAYDKLRAWCEKNNADMGYVIEQMRRYMLIHEVAPAMNGLV